jgi:hypothetical protein
MNDIQAVAASATIISTNRMGNETSRVIARNASAYQTTFNAPDTLAKPIESLDAAACQAISPVPNLPPEPVGDENVIIVPLNVTVLKRTHLIIVSTSALILTDPSNASSHANLPCEMKICKISSSVEDMKIVTKHESSVRDDIPLSISSLRDEILLVSKNFIHCRRNSPLIDN